MAHQYRGEGRTLKRAVKDAWKKAPKQGGEKTKYWVDQIWVEGSNPISWYGVELTDTPPPRP